MKEVAETCKVGCTPTSAASGENVDKCFMEIIQAAYDDLKKKGLPAEGVNLNKNDKKGKKKGCC